MHKIAFPRKHKRILQTIWQNTLCIHGIISGLHNLWTRQPSSMARAKLNFPCPGSGTCHQKGGKHAWQRPKSLSDVECSRISHHTRQPALTYNTTGEEMFPRYKYIQACKVGITFCTLRIFQNWSENVEVVDIKNLQAEQSKYKTWTVVNT